MSEMTCADVHTAAAEYALGLQDGVDRARLVAHLAACPTCRREVDDLGATADMLLTVGPVVEPPAGFEARVSKAMGAQEHTSSHRPGWGWILAAAAVVLIVAGSSVIVGRLTSHRSDLAVRSASMETPDGRVVGRVAVGADPDTVFVALPGWRPPDDGRKAEPYRLRLTLAGGRSQLVGPVHLGSGDGSWGTVLPVDARNVRRVALVGERGHAYCTGSLG